MKNNLLISALISLLGGNFLSPATPKPVNRRHPRYVKTEHDDQRLLRAEFKRAKRREKRRLDDLKTRAGRYL